MIVIATAIPTEVERPNVWEISLDVAIADVVVNMLLYMPLGAALARRGLLRTILFAGVLSSGIEVVQLFFRFRFASPVDVATNIAGACIAALLAGRSGGSWEVVELNGITRPILLGVLFFWWSTLRSVLHDPRLLPAAAALSGLISSCVLLSVAMPRTKCTHLILSAAFGLLGGMIALSIARDWRSELWVLGLSMVGGLVCVSHTISEGSQPR